MQHHPHHLLALKVHRHLHHPWHLHSNSLTIIKKDFKARFTGLFFGHGWPYTWWPWMAKEGV